MSSELATGMGNMEAKEAIRASDAVVPSLEWDILSVLRGLRNGLIYGAKIRFPHALVMSFLFGRGTIMDKFKNILTATWTHSRNLGLFVGAFKAGLALLRRIRGGKNDDPLNAFLAGFVASWFIWGPFTSINSQINMYVYARLIMGLTRYGQKNGYIKSLPYEYPIAASLCWAATLWLFYKDKSVLQGSLQDSSTYLYTESEKWPDLAKVGVLEWLMT
jgi:peroxisomal membrane protein 4